MGAFSSKHPALLDVMFTYLNIEEKTPYSGLVIVECVAAAIIACGQNRIRSQCFVGFETRCCVLIRHGDKAFKFSPFDAQLSASDI